MFMCNKKLSPGPSSRYHDKSRNERRPNRRGEDDRNFYSVCPLKNHFHWKRQRRARKRQQQKTYYVRSLNIPACFAHLTIGAKLIYSADEKSPISEWISNGFHVDLEKLKAPACWNWRLAILLIHFIVIVRWFFVLGFFFIFPSLLAFGSLNCLRSIDVVDSLKA